MTGVHTHLFLIAGLIELSIALDVVVIAYAFAVETGVMAGAEHVDGETLVAAGGRAMNHYKSNFSGHITLIFKCHTDLTDLTEIIILHRSQGSHRYLLAKANGERKTARRGYQQQK